MYKIHIKENIAKIRLGQNIYQREPKSTESYQEFYQGNNAYVSRGKQEKLGWPEIYQEQSIKFAGKTSKNRYSYFNLSQTDMKKATNLPKTKQEKINRLRLLY